MAGGAGAQRAQHVRPPGNFNGGNSDNQQQPTPLNNGNQNQNNGGRQNTGPAGYGGFDGPTDGSGTPRQNPFGPGLGFDPAKPAKKESVITNTRVELPASAYLLNKEVSRSICSRYVLSHSPVGVVVVEFRALREAQS